MSLILQYDDSPQPYHEELSQPSNSDNENEHLELRYQELEDSGGGEEEIAKERVGVVKQTLATLR